MHLQNQVFKKGFQCFSGKSTELNVNCVVNNFLNNIVKELLDSVVLNIFHRTIS